MGQNGQRGKLPGSGRQFNKATKEVLIILIIINMQTKLYTRQSSHHPMTDSQPVPQQQSQNPKLTDFAKKTELLEKFKLPEKRGF